MTKEDRAAIMAILTPSLGEELAADIISHRNGKKCPLTPRGARSLLREYEATGNAVEAAEEHLNRGWQGFKAAWIKQASRFTDQHNPTPRPSTNYGRAEIVKPPEPMSDEERARREQMAAKARAVVRGVSMQ